MPDSISLKFVFTPEDRKCVAAWDNREKARKSVSNRLGLFAIIPVAIAAMHVFGHRSWKAAILDLSERLGIVLGIAFALAGALKAISWSAKPETPKDVSCEVILSEDRIVYKGHHKSEQQSQESDWKGILRAVTTPDGIMIFWHSHALNNFAGDVWIPQRALSDKETRDRVYELLKRKVDFGTLNAVDAMKIEALPE
jgi:hypothetical protein